MTQRYKRLPYESTAINRAGGSRAWRRLRSQVVAEEPLCRIGLPGCTRVSVTADHIQPKRYRPDLAMDRRNLRGACKSCNDKRSSKSLAQVAAMKAQAASESKPPRALSFFRH